MTKLKTVEFERTGGFTGIPVRVVLDGSSMDSEETDRIMYMIENSGFFSITMEAGSEDQHPDQYGYRIYVETTTHQKSIEFSEGQVPEDLKPLIRFLSGLARKRK